MASIDDLPQRLARANQSQASEFGFAKAFDQTAGGYWDEREAVRNFLDAIKATTTDDETETHFDPGADPPDVVATFANGVIWAFEVSELCDASVRNSRAQGDTYVRADWTFESGSNLVRDRIQIKERKIAGAVVAATKKLLLLLVPELELEILCPQISAAGCSFEHFDEVWLMAGYSAGSHPVFPVRRLATASDIVQVPLSRHIDKR